MKEQPKVNPSKVSISYLRRNNDMTERTRYAIAAYPEQSVTRPYRNSSRKFTNSPATLKTLSDLVHEPVIIGAFIIAVCIVGSVYALSQWYYADFDPKPIPTETSVSKLTTSPALLVGMDLSGLSTSDAESDWRAETTNKPTQMQLETERYELTLEEEALLLEYLAETLPSPSRESPHGLGPYPEIPSDYPRQNVWRELEKSYSDGYTTIDHELIHRVLIKLWNQGKKADSGVLSEQNGRVYPLYTDTVYVEWSEVENEDGSVEAYLGSYLSHGSLNDYERAVAEGTQPSWLKVVSHEDGGINPHSFLDLP